MSSSFFLFLFSSIFLSFPLPLFFLILFFSLFFFNITALPGSTLPGYQPMRRGMSRWWDGDLVWDLEINQGISEGGGCAGCRKCEAKRSDTRPWLSCPAL
ncbi:hypothetical protein F4775DRAFT_575302, partial [Biscogniauxia sp. FL1348]